MSAPEWILLTAPGDLAVDQEEVLRPLAERLAERFPGVRVRTALLLGNGPTVTEVLDEAAAAGVAAVTVVHPQTVEDRATAAWLRRVVSHWLREADPERVPLVRLAPPLTGVSVLADAVGRAVEEAAEFPATGAPLLSPAWLAPPDFTRHLLLCRGPRCCALGAERVHVELVRAVERHGAAEDDHVLLTRTGCLFPCTNGPVGVVYPDGVWYRLADADTVDRVVRDHLVGGVPVADAAFARRPSGPGE
ncbi:(2Fe-2S) ferredoxin domain-containing protein [Thermobifida alba]|uniref:Cobalamin biosynthesis protein CbiX n=2 Tax=Thermobifida TaxID=83677 RepID=A0A147KGD9_THECS|nr:MULTISPECIES: (2Fe-2S) ferredoxin domain-containing protein [Thermobifida]KUP96356.1 hypothetical protein AC529_12585 [Thermobifida cellulosilytica TB100]UPT22827.1 (2Fe-2S) ferredoxin domain-containing protein [Thermobifida alba]